MQRIAARTAMPRLLAVVTALFAALALAAVPATAQDDDGVTPARVDGENRFDTAASIASLTFDEAEVAVIVTGGDFPDALAASFAAGSVDGPILLVEHDDVPEVTSEQLADLGVDTTVLVGGVNAISAEVEAQLESEGYETVRISGDDRFATAASVAQTYGQRAVGELGGDRTAFLASGEDASFPDALSAGPLAARAQMPLLLTPADRVDPVVDESLEELEIDRIIIVGGTEAVSSAVAQHYAQVYEVERFGGDNRNQTANIVADNAIERFAGFSAEGILLARGDDFPDALAASVHGAAIGAPILLTANPTVLSPDTEGWLFDACPEVDFIRALGGVNAVSTQALDEAVSAAERCHGRTDPGYTFCENTEHRFIVSYTDEWVTNTSEANGVPVCSLFDPDPESFDFEGNEVPADIGAFLRVEDVDYDEASTNDPRFEEELERREGTIDGRDAVRVESRATGEGYYEEDTLLTHWYADLGDATFIAVSTDVGEPSYAEKQQVLDEMVQSIMFRR